MLQFFKRIRQWVCSHEFEDVGERYPIGGTIAPYPAVDEFAQLQLCPKCGASRSRFAGFEFDPLK